jgi:hypothetical protein
MYTSVLDKKPLDIGLDFEYFVDNEFAVRGNTFLRRWPKSILGDRRGKRFHKDQNSQITSNFFGVFFYQPNKIGGKLSEKKSKRLRYWKIGQPDLTQEQKREVEEAGFNPEPVDLAPNKVAEFIISKIAKFLFDGIETKKSMYLVEKFFGVRLVLISKGIEPEQYSKIKKSKAKEEDIDAITAFNLKKLIAHMKSNGAPQEAIDSIVNNSHLSEKPPEKELVFIEFEQKRPQRRKKRAPDFQLIEKGKSGRLGEETTH